jgi:serine phosphatase RsbU (regulator of sigma subunit)
MRIALAGALAASAFACSAALAQLPELPKADPAPNQVEPVQQLPKQPLPGPVEDVVQDSPAAPVREQVEGLLGGAGAGGGGSDSGAGGGPSGSGAGGGSGPSAAAPGESVSPAAGGGSGSPGAGSGSPGGGSGDGAGRADPGSSRATPAASDQDGGRGAASSVRASGDRDQRGALARTVDRIVEVVPGYAWVAIGALALVALLLGARALVDNRRARALRHERERLLRDMGVLERALLPEVPERLGELTASVAYRPAAGPAAGGDFYDAFELSAGGVALLVGDVSGHGPEALERTSSLRPTLHAQLQAGMSPRAALAAAAGALAVEPDGGFTTVVVAVHDPTAGTLTYATAGHPPPIVTGPGAHEAITAVSSPPLGMGLPTGLRQTTVPFPRGSAACLFTDGLIEARSDGGLMGPERLAELVARLGPDEAADGLLERVVAQVDETLDDMTACLVRAVGASEAIAPRVEQLELRMEELESDRAARFLDACGLPADRIATALADVRRVASGAGAVVLTATIDGDVVSASATAPTSAAPATT